MRSLTEPAGLKYSSLARILALRIAGEQLLKLETLGLTPEEAEEKILEGFLR